MVPPGPCFVFSTLVNPPKFHPVSSDFYLSFSLKRVNLTRVSPRRFREIEKEPEYLEESIRGFLLRLTESCVRIRG